MAIQLVSVIDNGDGTATISGDDAGSPVETTVEIAALRKPPIVDPSLRGRARRDAMLEQMVAPLDPNTVGDLATAILERKFGYSQPEDPQPKAIEFVAPVKGGKKP